MITLLKNSREFPKSSEVNKVIKLLNDQRPQKVYKALVTQSSTTAPTVIALLNEIGAIVWTRTGVGTYIGTLAGKFLSGKVWASITLAGASNTVSIGIGRATDNTISITTMNGGVAADGVLNNASILIETYP